VSVIDVTLPDPRAMLAAYYVIATAEASTNLARFDGLAYGDRGEGAVYEEMVGRSRADGFGREVKRRILMGAFVLSAGRRDAYYGGAQLARRKITRQYVDTLKACDIVASPTAPTAAFPLGERLDDPRDMYDSDVFTVGPSLAGLPALTVPTGRDRDGLPLSIQLTGRRGGEDTLFALGALVERAGGCRGGGA
jgi:aspartyl-tRNA(Asn)/glutamyl-tRNA(Gln) amidotransferase subunit A